MQLYFLGLYQVISAIRWFTSSCSQTQLYPLNSQSKLVSQTKLENWLREIMFLPARSGITVKAKYTYIGKVKSKFRKQMILFRKIVKDSHLTNILRILSPIGGANYF